MKIDIALANDFNIDALNIDISKSVCAVIDVIRATSTITAILARGANSIIIARSKDEAFKLRNYYRDYILCGEEDGLPPDGFDYGNSPLQFSELDLKDKNIILKTTNGTVSFLKVKNSKAIFSLCLLNLKFTLNCVLDYCRKNKNDILLVWSGKKGRIAYDDVYVAGLAVKHLLGKPVKFDFSDSAKLALSVALSEKNATSALEKSCSAISLRGVGLGKDIKFCAQLNKYNTKGIAEILNSKGTDISGLDSLFILKPYII